MKYPKDSGKTKRESEGGEHESLGEPGSRPLSPYTFKAPTQRYPLVPPTSPDRMALNTDRQPDTFARSFSVQANTGGAIAVQSQSYFIRKFLQGWYDLLCVSGLGYYCIVNLAGKSSLAKGHRYGCGSSYKLGESGDPLGRHKFVPAASANPFLRAAVQSSCPSPSQFTPPGGSSLSLTPFSRSVPAPALYDMSTWTCQELPSALCRTYRARQMFD